MKYLLILLLACLSLIPLSAQVGINTNNPDPSAVLDVRGADGGLLIPRGTFAQRNAIQATKPGLLFYDVSLERMFITRTFNDTMMWMPLGPVWQENANAVFLDQPFPRRLGIGTSAPSVLFEVDGKSKFNDTIFATKFKIDSLIPLKYLETDALEVQGKAIFNDTMLVKETIFVPGRSYWNDTMLIAGFMDVSGKTRWNDTMMLTRFLDMQGKSSWNDTMLIAGFMDVSGKTRWNDTMMLTRFLDMQGKSSWNDTMLVNGYFDAVEMNVSGKAVFNDTIMVSDILQANSIFVPGRTYFNDTMLVAGVMDVTNTSAFNDTVLLKEHMDVTGNAVFNDTIFAAFQEVSGLEVNGKSLFNDTIFAKNLDVQNIILDAPANETAKPVFVDPTGRLSVWNDTMMIAFNALGFRSSFPVDTDFGDNLISAGLQTPNDGAAMWAPLEIPLARGGSGWVNDSLIFVFIDNAPANLTISLMEMKNNGSGMTEVFSTTTNGNVSGVRKLALDTSASPAVLDPRNASYFIKVSSSSWNAGVQRVVSGYLVITMTN